jgi:hypothetical protein
MARTAIEITQEALVGLGVERLAAMLVEHATTDGSLARKLKLALDGLTEPRLRLAGSWNHKGLQERSGGSVRRS